MLNGKSNLRMPRSFAFYMHTTTYHAMQGWLSLFTHCLSFLPQLNIPTKQIRRSEFLMEVSRPVLLRGSSKTLDGEQSCCWQMSVEQMQKYYHQLFIMIFISICPLQLTFFCVAGKRSNLEVYEIFSISLKCKRGNVSSFLFF